MFVVVCVFRLLNGRDLSRIKSGAASFVDAYVRVNITDPSPHIVFNLYQFCEPIHAPSSPEGNIAFTEG